MESNKISSGSNEKLNIVVTYNINIYFFINDAKNEDGEKQIKVLRIKRNFFEYFSSFSLVRILSNKMHGISKKMQIAIYQ